MRQIKTIVIHCAATPPDMDIGADTIRSWHKDRGWSDIGYHYVIRRDGTVELGRDLDGDGNVLEEVGAHARGHNSNSLGICLIGGKGSQRDDRPELHYTPEQLESLETLVDALQLVFGGTLEVLGHNDLTSAKACPGFDARRWYAEHLQGI